MAEPVAVSVIVAARDAAATLERTLSALLDQDFEPGFEVIVCDDGSSDGTAEILRRFPRVRALTSPATGPAAARNAAIAQARGAVLAFTDADCFPTRAWLRAGLAAMTQADLIQGPVLPDPAAPRGPFDRTLDYPAASPWFPTANLFARRALVEQAGGFETLALDDDGGRRQPLGEDTLLAWRVRRAGARPAFAPDAVVHHAVFARDARRYVTFHRHLRRLPAVVRAVPELRDDLLVGRCFLSRRSLLFDVAVASLTVGLLARHPAARAVGVACAVPYARAVLDEARRWPRTPKARFAAARVAADLVSCGALLTGSARARALVI